MPIGTMQFGTVNDAGTNETRLTSDATTPTSDAGATLVVENRAFPASAIRGVAQYIGVGGSARDYAVFGFTKPETGGTGVYGRGLRGVNGRGPIGGAGIGVNGVTDNGIGVLGETHSDIGIGVKGQTPEQRSSRFTVGVWGIANHLDGAGTGVRAEALSANAVAVQGN